MDDRTIYPNWLDYLEAVANPEGRFVLLDGCRPLLDGDGLPVFVSANDRIVFTVEFGGRKCRMICFTRRRDDLAESGELFPDEIYVYSGPRKSGGYWPVVVMGDEEQIPVMPAADFQMEYGELCDGMRVVVRDGKFGFVDGENHLVIEPVYAWAGDFGEGRAAVASAQGMMGLIDVTGRTVIPLEYDDLSWDGSRFAYVDMEGRHGCLDRSGEVVIPLEYDWVGEFDYGYAVVCREERYGYVNERGEVVGDGLIYSDASSVGSDGVARVVLSDGSPGSVRLDSDL